MIEWTYSDIRRVAQLPPCPDCKSAASVVLVSPQSARYECKACGTSYTAWPVPPGTIRR